MVKNFADFAPSLEEGDHFFILDNGNQNLPWENTSKYSCATPPFNLGVSRSWNVFLKMAFEKENFDACIILQDDIVWTTHHVNQAKNLLRDEKHQKVDLFLAHHQFSIQVHRASNIHTIGYYDETFSPAWCEDDDYALTMITKNRIYKRFHELNPADGSMTEGTTKPNAWQENHAKLKAKWGHQFKFLDSCFGVNFQDRHYYESNEHILFANDHLFIKPRG